ncbi:hypothetical protein, partial [Hungatella effluvii]|uniref:hypothetical protein n=1 Tax=Hungatella effluvii TaxID=1096246 RepID=UPI002A838C96
GFGGKQILLNHALDLYKISSSLQKPRTRQPTNSKKDKSPANQEVNDGRQNDTNAISAVSGVGNEGT